MPGLSLLITHIGWLWADTYFEKHPLIRIFGITYIYIYYHQPINYVEVDVPKLEGQGEICFPQMLQSRIPKPQRLWHVWLCHAVPLKAGRFANKNRCSCWDVLELSGAESFWRSSIKRPFEVIALGPMEELQIRGWFSWGTRSELCCFKEPLVLVDIYNSARYPSIRLSNCGTMQLHAVHSFVNIEAEWTLTNWTQSFLDELD